MRTQYEKHITLATFLWLSTCGMSYAQKPSEYLITYDSFFQSQSVEMNKWLKEYFPKGQLRAKAIVTDSSTVTLQLMPADTLHSSCATTQFAWETAEKNHTTTDFNQRVLLRWAFLAEINPDQAKVEVKCHEPAHFYRHISMPKGSTIHTDGRSVRAIAPVVLPFGPKDETTKSSDGSELAVTLKGHNAVQVSQKLRQFCQSKYVSLPKARYIWDAVLQFTDISETEFQLEVTYITNVVTSDRYYEYHKIYIVTQQSGENTLINVRLQGKYGSGIIFAPRRNDYKDMETAYKSELAEYRNIFFKQLTNAALK
jgi:hypothetical protein